MNPTENHPERGPKSQASGPESSASPDRMAELEADLAQLNATYRRLAADFENYKRRKGQEGEELARYGAAALLQALLPALDNLDRAASHIPEDAADGLAEGLRLTVKQLGEALASQGIRRIASVGEPFDPRLHNAVLTVPAPGAEPGTVVAVLAPGYLIHDRVIRPAQVSVAEAGAASPARKGPERRAGSKPGPGTSPTRGRPN
ncbi:MAG: nucleotide exchange factor GrpE [Candidatus Dormiibacterota bacterium]